MQEYIRIHKKDNVAVALTELNKGTEVMVDNHPIILNEKIPSGHKFCIANIKQGEPVIKYGFPIGCAKEDLLTGTWIHTHNILTTLGDNVEYDYAPQTMQDMEWKEAYFNGYKRTDGKVGIRNQIWIIPTVGCVNSIAEALARRMNKNLPDTVDQVIAFGHPYGCSQLGDDQENTRKILANLINHPNAGGVLVLGLGCENSSIKELLAYIGEFDKNRVKFLQCQDVEDEMEAAELLIKELISYAGSYVREKINAKELIVGLKCGGSDGFSGITANPLVGAFSDVMISHGGTTILTEVPEMFGAETLLMNRCQNAELFHKTVEMITDFKEYYRRHNQTIYENPSPGNKEGGISTLEDKSLGCTQKSGNAPVTDVLKYGDIITTKGLNLLSSPGNDLVAATALAAAGAHLVLFTTGRGTPFASPVPTMKISSNTGLYDKKKNWIDFDAGKLLNEEGMESLTEELFQYVLEIASGKQVKSEAAGFHDMAIFKQGVTL
ncbi:altronate dehydratase [Mobilitalea sibirica]|uniref:Altronate dehydratase n=1 Tax=Mobilitalea sibirica TaxID=1462919 RepID=A0A8J7H1T0_9FIRM|nr:altronate dehydratase family protein [Mobilitalea sibirica]MBH1940514.1 altronate dehydratase [Mobilitalea sibirica]